MSSRDRMWIERADNWRSLYSTYRKIEKDTTPNFSFPHHITQPCCTIRYICVYLKACEPIRASHKGIKIMLSWRLCKEVITEFRVLRISVWYMKTPWTNPWRKQSLQIQAGKKSLYEHSEFWYELDFESCYSTHRFHMEEILRSTIATSAYLESGLIPTRPWQRDNADGT